MNIKLKYLTFILSAILNIFFVYSTLVNKHYPYYELAINYRSAETYLKSFFQKEADFINNLRDSQSDKQSNYNESYKSIETNLLPLKLSYKDLSSKLVEYSLKKSFNLLKFVSILSFLNKNLIYETFLSILVISQLSQ